MERPAWCYSSPPWSSSSPPTAGCAGCRCERSRGRNMSDAILTRRAAIAAVLMAAAAAGGQAMVPTRRMALLRGPFKLDDLVPMRFGNWHVDTRSAGGIIDPQTEAILNKLYSQILSRFYVDDAGHQVML